MLSEGNMIGGQISEYERLRLEKIRRNKALVRLFAATRHCIVICLTITALMVKDFPCEQETFRSVKDQFEV